MYTYKLIPNGYEIYTNGRLFIRQINCPIHTHENVTETIATNFAKLVIEKLNRRLSPMITEEEEWELVSSEITDERIQQLADLWQDK